MNVTLEDKLLTVWNKEIGVFQLGRIMCTGVEKINSLGIMCGLPMAKTSDASEGWQVNPEKYSSQESSKGDGKQCACVRVC